MKIDPQKEVQAVTETIAWLHQAWLLTEEGRLLTPDPFYIRNNELTPEVVAKVIHGIEDIFVTELQKYPSYHRNAQGISAGESLVAPGFDTLPYPQQLAVVQGIDRIFQRYRITETESPEDLARSASAS